MDEMAEPVGAVIGGLAAKARCNGRLQRYRVSHPVEAAQDSFED